MAGGFPAYSESHSNGTGAVHVEDWGDLLNEPFMVIFELFLVASAFILWLMRNFLARAGVAGFEWLPETSKLRNYGFQIRLCAIACSALGVVGVAIILVGGIGVI